MGNKVIGGCGLFLAGILALASAAVYAQSGAAPAAAPGFAQIPNGKDTDLKFYPAGGNKLLGAQALARMRVHRRKRSRAEYNGFKRDQAPSALRNSPVTRVASAVMRT